MKNKNDKVAAVTHTERARTRRLPKSVIAREWLPYETAAAASRAKGSLWSRMEDLVIHSDSLPEDLSANKAHLRNYGQNRRHRRRRD